VPAFDIEGASLDEAKAWLRTHFEKGTHCPCCRRFVKLYKRNINSSMAAALILLYRWDQRHPGQWMQITDVIAEASAGLQRRYVTDVAKLAAWEVIEPLEGERDDGSKRNGFWRMTDVGRDFCSGRILLPKYTYHYNQEVLHRKNPDPTMASIREALGDKFNYDELMRATPETLKEKTL